MGALLDMLSVKRPLLSDGAWGTMLQSRGLGAGKCPELLNIERPDVVKSVATAYVEAGSEVILTNTFGGSRAKLAKYGLGDKVEDINRIGVELSLAGAGDRAVVAASVGPTGDILEPYGDAIEEEMSAVFLEQLSAIVAGGAKVVCIETMTAIEEAVLAVKAAKMVDSGLDVICTMTFDPVPDGFKTMMGIDCHRAAIELVAAGADVIGANCGNGMEQMIGIARELRAAADKPILIHANAGVPELVDGKTVFRESPESMAAGVEKLFEAGASIIGGCCGTTDRHIAAMCREIRRLRGE